MDRLGHEDVSTIVGYTHINAPDHRRIAAELGKVVLPEGEFFAQIDELEMQLYKE